MHVKTYLEIKNPFHFTISAFHPSHSSGLQADFVTKVKLIRERLESRESETLGKWMTLEALRKCGTYTASEIKNIKNYCEKFPEALCRLHWGWDCLYPRKYSHVLHIHACFCISGIACSYSHVAGLGDTMTKWASTMSSLKIAPCTRSLTPRVKLRKPSAPKLGIWIMFAWCDMYKYVQTLFYHNKSHNHASGLSMTCPWKNHPFIILDSFPQPKPTWGLG